MANKAPSNPTITVTKELTKSLSFSDLEAARQFGARLASLLRPGDMIRLEGDLGAGKTELARSVIQSRVNGSIDVPSPTFTLVQIYELSDLTIVHADLYRLGDAEELDELGLFDDPDAAFLIEWWSRAEELLPTPDLVIELIQGAGDQERNVRMTAAPNRWHTRLETLCA